MTKQSFLPDDKSNYSDESDKNLEEVDVPEILEQKTSHYPLYAVFIFAVVYVAPIMKLYPTAHTCLAILCTICFLWITEAIPPFATAYLIPILSVWLQIGVDKNTQKRIPSPELAQFFAFKFMDPIIFVFFGSLVLSTGLQKLNITSRVSRFILSLVSPKPSIILLVLMLINLSIGAFLSNVASTTLTLSLAMPIIRSCRPSDPFIKAMLFGIAWSGNCGGQPTTIASPQNVIASHVVDTADSHVSFLGWIVFGTPVSIVLTVAQWYYLIKVFPKNENERLVVPQAADEAPWSMKHTQAVVITFITIFLWSLGDSLSWFMGHIGIASLIPIVWFFGSGILTTNDFNTLKWSTLSLLGGGLALGEAMKISGLLDVIAMGAKKSLDGVSPWVLLVIILIIEGCLASLLSSTTAASIMFPLIVAVGGNTGHAPLLVVLSALMISSSQLFHISSFPNALVSGVCVECSEEVAKVENVENGTPFLKGIDYVIYGWPTVAMGIGTIASLGYFLASGLGL
ncbi:Sodium:sulfate symporter transmembrane region family protein [Tritrichomonas foetus]|uniref:Sodium:sulfate symporter transmembrane region family protein n=1 Tax=Tritrichomonas foetus TaxID=1144522 RepID=A0A1J4KCU9_9EUKA|nr:Sodium:sulfate symporter transmembrane region family protein [Tritrichomonas foetus]|eukprot:OHT07277.1 Sodium:sulfate symporter transmembrane region family protein [Tritrichomonas foetus]